MVNEIFDDTHEENEAEHLYCPSKASKGRLLCFNGRDKKDGIKNSYVLALRESLPDLAILLESLTFVSYTYYDHKNLWHGLCVMAPFVRCSRKNDFLKPVRSVLFQWGELRLRMGSWVQQLKQANFSETKAEKNLMEKMYLIVLRRGSRSFKNATAVTDIFAKECDQVESYILHVVQSEDLSFCDQVKVLTNIDIVASPVEHS
ncbi:uncharacterized protein LOC132038090 [Lycium ferocissimum]|uniref:uncharacterized protein LOC132038090 n=1 Tax=Lycium ferocissimum TaxID=112874 RepID=UPI0028159077|nr:uncharacterized protein LOC132038090 [Lycium ferocissimum]